jgi:hypothetical protein
MTTSRWIAAGALAAGLVMALPSVASAAPQVSTVAQRCSNAITTRFTQIDQLKNQLASAPNVDAGHRSSLTAELTNDRSGLATLQGQITSATTLSQLVTLCPQIVSNFRVYVLETPKVHLTIAADRETAISTKLGGIATKLGTAITDAQGHGKDVGQAPTLLADLNAKVADASSQAGGGPGSILGLTPAQYNAGTAKPALESARNAVVAARGELETARSDAQQIVTILKAS